MAIGYRGWRVHDQSVYALALSFRNQDDQLDTAVLYDQMEIYWLLVAPDPCWIGSSVTACWQSAMVLVQKSSRQTSWSQS